MKVPKLTQNSPGRLPDGTEQIRKMSVIDVGGTYVKLQATDRDTKRKFVSGPTLPPERMVAEVRKLVCLGTGLESAVIVGGIVEPMESGHLPYRKGDFEVCTGLRGLEKYGKKKWWRYAADAVERLIAALEPEDVVLSGGDAQKLKKLPPGCRAGDKAFCGGFRLCEKTDVTTRDKHPCVRGADRPLDLKR